MNAQEQKKKMEASIRQLFKSACTGKKKISFTGVEDDTAYMHTRIELGNGYYLTLQSDTDSENRNDLVYAPTLRHEEENGFGDLWIRMERGQGVDSIVWFVKHFDENLDELEKVRAISVAYEGAMEHINDLQRTVKERFATKMAELSLD